MDSKTLKNMSDNMQDITFVLTNRNYDRLGILNNVDINTFRYKKTINGQELSFDIYKFLNDTEENLWDSIIDLKLLWIKEFDIYFEIYVTMEDSTSIKKSITATSLCEAELSQTSLYNIEINTELDIARDDYKITTFYNSDPQASLLHRILSKAPNYKIKHVDASLSKMQRSFSVDGQSIYDFLIGECAEQFNCIFQFDSRDRSVSAYDLYAVCQNKDCDYRSDIADFTSVGKYGSLTYTCPKCNGLNVKYYGEDTGIFIDKENLTDAVQFTTDIDSVKNCFQLVAGDDVITAAVRLLNMNGTNYIYCITDEQRNDMPKELVDKIEQYDKLYLSYQKEYETIIDDIYASSSKIYYYRNSMMPAREHAEVTAKTEAYKLTEHNLSPLGLSSVSSSTSRTTVESALKNYAKVYVKTGYVKLEVNTGSFTYTGTDSSGYHYGYWTGNFKITNYSDSEDVAYSDTITVKVHDRYDDFINQKVKKVIADEDDEDGSVFDVLSVSKLDRFKEILSYYGLNRLKSFYDAIQSAMDCLVQMNQASREAEMYNTLYLPYYNKLQACQHEINARQATVDQWQRAYDHAVLKQQKIQAALNFENYIGKELYQLFCCYRREDTYQNDNYISDGLKDPEIITRAKEFLEAAQKELIKSATRQHSISTTLYDLILIPEFKPLLNKFEIGNWLRIKADDTVYRLRLIEYEISFSDINTISVNFSDVTKINDSVTDTANILQSAKSMATNYSYISKQAEAGSSANESIDHWILEGLNSALIHIKNNDREEITYDKHGLLAREYDDISDSYGDDQLLITHNILAFTEDNWKTVSLGLGKHTYIYYDENKHEFVTNVGYGVSAKFCTASYIYGSQIIGGDIYSSNYAPTTGTHIDLKDGTFSFAGGNLSYDSKTLSGKNLDISASLITGTTMNASTISGTTINGSNIYGTYINGGTITGTDIYSSNLYSGYISGGTIEGTYIKGVKIEGSTFETSGTLDGFSGTLKIKDGTIVGYYGNGNEAYKITTYSIDLGGSAIIVSGFRSFNKTVDILNGALTVSANKIDLKRDVYFGGDLYVNGDNLLSTLYIEAEYESGESQYAFGEKLITFSNANNNRAMATTAAYVQAYVQGYVSDYVSNHAASKSSVNSLQSRVSGLESAVGQLGGTGSGSFSN